MKKLIVVFFISMIVSFLSCENKEKSSKEAASSSQLTKIVLGILPNEKSKDLDGFKAELKHKIGLDVDIFVAKDYDELVKNFKDAKVDFAFFTAMTFIEAEREAGAKVLLKKVYGDNEFYYSAIVTLEKNKLKRLTDLKGKKFGFVDPKSTSGYLYPRLLLRNAGMDAGPRVKEGVAITLPYEFFGTHDDALKALLDGKVAAVGVWAENEGKKGAWTEGGFADKKNEFKVLAVSDPIPNDAFAVREKFYTDHPMVVFQVMEALIGMSDAKDNILKRVFDVDSMATATSRHYDSVRALESLIKEK